jgi:hypothetical protein
MLNIATLFATIGLVTLAHLWSDASQNLGAVADEERQFVLLGVAKNQVTTQRIVPDAFRLCNRKWVTIRECYR